MRTRIIVSTLSLVAVAAVSGCGSGGGAGSGTVLLSKSQLGSAVITLDDLGPGFKVDNSKDSKDGPDLGCLNGLDKLDKSGIQPVRDKDASYAADSDLALPGVYSTVGTFTSAAKAAAVLKEFSSAIKDCKTVDVTDKTGFRLKLSVSSNSTETDPAATAQLNLEASGSAGVKNVKFPFSLRFSAIQIDNQVALVGYVDMVETLGAEADAIDQRAYDRLAPVAAGKEAPKLAPLDLKVTDLNGLSSNAA